MRYTNNNQTILRFNAHLSVYTGIIMCAHCTHEKKRRVMHQHLYIFKYDMIKYSNRIRRLGEQVVYNNVRPFCNTQPCANYNMIFFFFFYIHYVPIVIRFPIYIRTERRTLSLLAVVYLLLYTRRTRIWIARVFSARLVVDTIFFFLPHTRA